MAVKRDESMQVSAPRFDWSFNFGHVLQSLTLGVTVVGGIWWTSARLENMETRMRRAESDVTIHDDRLKELTKSSYIHSEQLKYITTAITDNKAVNDKIIDRLGSIQESVAAIKATKP